MPRTRANINRLVSRDVANTIDEKVNQSIRATGVGSGLTKKVEDYPEFITAEAENVISNANSYIVLGRDRPSNRLSGYGGIGATGAHSIDLVVGRKAPGAEPNQRVFVDPMFKYDAARLYISERTDIDDNFNITNGSIGPSRNMSAIGLKADAIRIIGDEGGIKLVTKVNEKNTNNQTISKINGIELIAGNNDKDLQPMVKGANLVELLSNMLKQINNLNGMVISLATSQTLFEAALLAHVHIPSVAPSLVLPAPVAIKLAQNTQQISKGIMQKVNLATAELNFLSTLGKKYILSNHNKVN
tara:strand:- start:224 stop:1126 length:903 start_codon:yes stop_codon:yes gene_type:complete